MLKFLRIALGIAFIVYGLLMITHIVHADSPGSGGYGILTGPQNDGNGPNQPPPPPGSNVPYN